MRMLVTALLALTVCDAAHAGVTFLGPTPYLSKADSPFPVDGSNPSFYLEDFEDGELNTPGIFQPLHHLFGTAFHGEVIGPSPFTDSVDSDDGLLDGSGAGGHAFRSNQLLTNPTLPQRNTVAVTLQFDGQAVPGLPTAFGFVWTDGPNGIDYFRPGLELRMVITDVMGEDFESPYFAMSGNRGRGGATSQDVFIGAISDIPIREIDIFGVYYGETELMPYLEIDHVQYGRLTVPEPQHLKAILLLFALGGIFKAWHGAGPLSITTGHLWASRRATHRVRFLTAILISLTATSAAHAGVMFLGPTPYLSKADSPFPVDGSNPNFYLEDFEDGELNTPGIFQPLHPATYAVVRGPGVLANSVDGDDGFVDGIGVGSHSIASSFYMFYPTTPPRVTSYISDRSQLGFLPTNFGFVWTDGVADSVVRIELFNEEFESLGFSMFSGIGSGNSGDPSDDRFFGVTGNTEIATVEITSQYVGSSSFFEIDHVQYGYLAVPEPATWLSSLSAISMLLAIRRSMARRRPDCASAMSQPRPALSRSMVLSRPAFALAGVMALACGEASAVSARYLYKLTAPDPQPGAKFGQDISIIDGDILVGEPSRFHPDTGVGRAYLFDGKTGDLKFGLNNPELMNLDEFARATAGGDGRIFVSVNGLEERVYVFDAVDGEWLGEISDPHGPPPGIRGGQTSFGTGLGYGDGSLLVTAPSFDLNSQLRNVGQAYLFNGVTGALTQTVANPEPKSADILGGGVSFAVLRDKVVIGAVLDDLPDDDRPDGDNPGRVWVYDRDSGDVAFTLENPNPESRFFDWFGWSIAANEEMIVVGAREDGTSGVDGSGTVYIFDTLTGDLRRTLFSPQSESNGEFGRSVAITPDGNVLVGAWGTSVSGVEGAGHVYLFDGATGDLLLDLPNPQPAEFGLFGYTVATMGNQIVVGGNEGVYVFALVPEPHTSAVMAVAALGCLFGIRRRSLPIGLSKLRRHPVRPLAALLFFLTVADAASGAVVFLGPTPYLSKTDSPFPVDGSNPNFYLEDFEDGELNTPGIKPGTPQFPLPAEMGGVVLSPGSNADSVDGDDGALDGDGSAGYSLRSDLNFFTPTIPPLQQLQIVFDFDSSELGFLPNHFGFVWTDGRENSSLTFTVTTASGTEIQFPLVHELGDSLRDGSTLEDRFVGVRTGEGISRVTLFGGYVGDNNGFDYFEIDHVQYGYLAIPEPATALFAVVALALIVSGPRLLQGRRMRCVSSGNAAVI